ncbi:putative F-box/LRR-repeat protein 7 isoform X1 [Apostichopus japonicus]|uniref:Putative F-box/LRR-repeat protein 7 isoform X1 n=1 Tax=Stichopus japonicus TaxID=307972 RepID=A0A2G8KFS3_STIJA|nr:putative F-box/LRR-repeat protein 7 isoform X1 [Apostichopus japonicus]
MLASLLQSSLACKQLNCMNLPADNMNLDPAMFLKQKINLRFLDMSDCPLLDDDGLRTIATNCPALVNVYLRKCDLISDVGVQYLSNYCLMLREISLSDCPRVTDLGLRELSS